MVDSLLMEQIYLVLRIIFSFYPHNISTISTVEMNIYFNLVDQWHMVYLLLLV